MPVIRPRGVVAAGHRLSAEAAAGVLRDGGNARDAAIAGLAMACVCEPVLCSPGGGGFAMVRDGSTGAISVVDFFAHTPLVRRDVDGDAVRLIHADFGTTTQAFHVGPGTTATPGFFAGVEAVRSLGSSMSLERLFAPAVEAARAGVRISEFQHYLSTVVRPILVATEPAAALFAPDGDLRPAGSLFENPGLAGAFEEVAHAGFRGGRVERECIESQAGRGHLTAADLDAYSATWRDPLVVDVGGWTIHLNPLPAAGGTLIAHTLRGLVPAEAPTSPIVMAEALRATGQARSQAGNRVVELDGSTLRPRGTTHVSVIDGDGNACAVSTSNGEGNGELVDGFGFMLNNILGEDDVNPDGPGWPANTRLSSMMCPTIIEGPSGEIVALGSGGSNRIRSAIAQVVAALCGGGTDLTSAVTAPRLHVEGDHLDFENHLEDAIGAELRRRFPDHRAWPEPNLFFGGVHAVRADADGALLGVGDARRDGAAIVVDG